MNHFRKESVRLLTCAVGVVFTTSGLFILYITFFKCMTLCLKGHSPPETTCPHMRTYMHISAAFKQLFHSSLLFFHIRKHVPVQACKNLSMNTTVVLL